MYIFHRYYYWLFLFINATIINRKKVDLFLFFQFVKIIKWWHLTLLHIRWTKSHEILWFIKRIFPQNLFLLLLFDFFQAVTWQSLCSVFISEVVRLICVLCDAVVCVRSSCLMFMYWDASCRSHVAFLMNCFRRLSTFFILSLFVSLSVFLSSLPPLKTLARMNLAACVRKTIMSGTFRSADNGPFLC